MATASLTRNAAGFSRGGAKHACDHVKGVIDAAADVGLFSMHGKQGAAIQRAYGCAINAEGLAFDETPDSGAL